MKYGFALFVPALLCGAVLAQDSSTQPGTQPGVPTSSPTAPQTQTQPTAPPAANSAAAPTGNPLKIAPGSVIPVTLAKTVDAKKAKSGDEVVATVTQDMKTNSGDVLVPKDTKIVGHVTEAQARNKEQKESQLGIAFDHAVVKGDQMPLPMSIQAIIAPQQNNPGNGPSENAPSASASPSGPAASSTAGGRSSSTGGSSQSASQQSSPQGPGASESEPQTSARPPITGSTQGVIGMPDMKLDNNAQNSTQGSVVTSEKNNVKIEKGTFMLLRVNQAGQAMPQAQPSPQQ